MWQRRRGVAVAGTRRAGTSAGEGYRPRWGGRRAWRVDRHTVPRVALTPLPEFMPRSSHVGLRPGPAAWPMDGRPGEAMLSVQCSQCGRPNPDGARFCAHCGSPLPRPASGERPGESTSTISLGGWESAEAEAADETAATDTAAVEVLPAGTALLVVRRGPNAGSRFLLDSDLTTAGRHPESDIFLDDVTVSRRHAEFYRQGETFTVRDVGSLNGTYVNRERIEESGLNAGDEVQVGKFRLVFLTNPHEELNGGGARDEA
jgi:FHA domain/zinc-ribbon domain